MTEAWAQTEAPEEPETPEPATPPEPTVDIDAVVSEAVNRAVADVESRHCTELETLHKKVQDLISKKNGEIEKVGESLVFYKTKCLELEACLKNLAT
jgi:hypothetical protein